MGLQRQEKHVCSRSKVVSEQLSRLFCPLLQFFFVWCTNCFETEPWLLRNPWNRVWGRRSSFNGFVSAFVLLFLPFTSPKRAAHLLGKFSKIYFPLLTIFHSRKTQTVISIPFICSLWTCLSPQRRSTRFFFLFSPCVTREILHRVEFFPPSLAAGKRLYFR